MAGCGNRVLHPENCVALLLLLLYFCLGFFFIIFFFYLPRFVFLLDVFSFSLSVYCSLLTPLSTCRNVLVTASEILLVFFLKYTEF